MHNINIKLSSPLAKTPTYATDGSGCFDIYSITKGVPSCADCAQRRSERALC